MIAAQWFGAPGVKAVLDQASALDSDAPGPLDGVSPAALAAYWRAHGARVGIVSSRRDPVLG
jgi:hypothetical protein